MLKIYNLKNATDRIDFKEKLISISGKSPYNVPDYFELFSPVEGDLICFRLDIGDETILLPGYKRIIQGFEGYYDFVSPYGYSGPIFRSDIDRNKLNIFWNEVLDWFRKNNFISAFIRFSLNENYDFFPGELKQTMLNVKGVILQSEEEQWFNYDRKVRKNLKRAIREGLKIKIVRGEEVTNNQIEDFHNVYISTMERTNAIDDFFYDKEVFHKFISLDGKLCEFAFVEDNGLITSVEMVLLSDDSAYSFLGGTLSDHFSNRPNDFLKHNLINYFREIGLKYFVLGGGYGSDDGIFKYKRSFFPNDIVDFYTGRWVILPDIYNIVLGKAKLFYESVHGFSEELDKKDFFPPYRKYLV